MALVANQEFFESKGLVAKAIWLFEYDIPSAWNKNVVVDGKVIQVLADGYTKENAKFFQDLRNTVVYQLRYVLKASKNLYSSWIINETQYTEATKLGQWVREQLIEKGFAESAEKVNIFPIYTNQVGYQSYEDRKSDFYLEFLTEIQESMAKGMEKLNKNTLKLNEVNNIVWKAKKGVEIVNEMKENIEDKTSKHSRYNEIVDLLGLTEGQLAELESKLIEAKEVRKAEKELAKQEAKTKGLNP